MMEVIDQIDPPKKKFERESYINDRLLHLLLDVVISLATMTLFTVRFKFISGSTHNLIKENSMLITFVIYHLHTFLSELILGKTFGKFVRNTRVVNENLEKPSSKQIIIRSLVKLIPFEGILIFSSFRRPLHDTWSKTMVIKKVKL